MTTFTTNFSWPKPAGTDAPDNPGQVGALADAADSTVQGISAQLPYRARQTLVSSAATVTFSSIPSALRRLRVFWTARGDAAVQTQYMFLRVNGDTGNNYNSEVIFGTNTTPSSGSLAAVSGGAGGYVVGASAQVNDYSSGTIDFVGWDSPHTSFLGWTCQAGALGTGAANFTVMNAAGQYVIAGPYTSLTLYPNAGNFIAGSDFQLEGAVT